MDPPWHILTFMSLVNSHMAGKVPGAPWPETAAAMRGAAGG